MKESYFRDIFALKKDGGKAWVATASMSPAVTSPTFPAINFVNAKSEEVSTPQIFQTKVSLVQIGFKNSAQPSLLSWVDPVKKELGSDSKLSIYDVSFVESSMFKTMRTVFMSSIQKKIPERDHANYLVHFGAATPFFSSLFIQNK